MTKTLRTTPTVGEVMKYGADSAKNKLSHLRDEEFQAFAAAIMTRASRDRRRTQMLYYEPASERASRIHYDTARRIGVSGGNRCLSLDSPVLMADGSWRALGDIQRGDIVMAADPETGKTAPAPVLATFYSGRKEVFQVTFSDGGSFEASADHMVPLYLGSGRLTSKGYPKKPHKRRLGDYIEPINRRGAANPSKRISAVSPRDLSLPDKQAPVDRERYPGCRRRICREVRSLGIKDCGDIEVDHPAHCYITGDYVIVSNSSKTESCLVEIMSLATGVFPHCIAEEQKKKFRGPINVRICITNLKLVLHQILLPKLKWWVWTGHGAPGTNQGHWGWIPQDCLFEGSWEHSWNEGQRVLRILCKDPDNIDHTIGESRIQVLSYDQDPAHYASGSFHEILHDEPPPQAIWRENQARVLDVNGRLWVAMTWPDDASISVDWIYDELYEPAKHSDGVSWHELKTLENVHLDRAAVAAQSADWSETEKLVRLEGQPIRFSNRIHPLFTSVTCAWCFRCGKEVPRQPDQKCHQCGDATAEYNHVTDEVWPAAWPTVFLLDPHPRKPHMFCWARIRPDDDILIEAESQISADTLEVAEHIEQIERERGWNISLRLMDPNMGRSPASARERDLDWQTAFSRVNVECQLASDADVGRDRVNEYLKPDKSTFQPRLKFHESCTTAIQHFERFSWDNWRLSAERGLKETPRDKYDDYPAMLRYLLNWMPSFHDLMIGPTVLRQPGTPRRNHRRAH